METKISHDYLESNHELICLSMKFAKLSNQQRDVLKTLANNNNATNKEIATIMKIAHGSASSALSTLKVEGWVESTTSGRNAFWFFVDEDVRTFVQWKLCEAKLNQSLRANKEERQNEKSQHSRRRTVQSLALNRWAGND